MKDQKATSNAKWNVATKFETVTFHLATLNSKKEQFDESSAAGRNWKPGNALQLHLSIHNIVWFIKSKKILIHLPASNTCMLYICFTVAIWSFIYYNHLLLVLSSNLILALSHQAIFSQDNMISCAHGCIVSHPSVMHLSFRHTASIGTSYAASSQRHVTLSHQPNDTRLLSPSLHVPHQPWCWLTQLLWFSFLLSYPQLTPSNNGAA